MKSTGEVMGGAGTFGTAFAKAQLGAGVKLPSEGCAFISVNNHDKPAVLPDRARPRRPRFQAGRDARHGQLPARARSRGRDRLQGQRGAPARRRRDPQPPDSARHQYASRPRVVLRRPHRPPDCHDAVGAVHHHADRGCGDGQRDSRLPQRRPHRAGAPGIPRTNCDEAGLAGPRFLRRGTPLFTFPSDKTATGAPARSGAPVLAPGRACEYPPQSRRCRFSSGRSPA